MNTPLTYAEALKKILWQDTNADPEWRLSDEARAEMVVAMERAAEKQRGRGR